MNDKKIKYDKIKNAAMGFFLKSVFKKLKTYNYEIGKV